MGYQFMHVESYARVAGKGKQGGRSISDVAAEAERRPEACPHITYAQAPVVLYGTMPAAAAAKATAWAEKAKDSRGHRLRKDGLCMLAGVISYPVSRGSWNRFRDDSIAYLQRKFGVRLKSVIEHVDESHPHLHFYVVPKRGERFDDIHDGRAAAGRSKADGEKKGAQNTAFKTAMREWQDSFWQQVGSRHGLARTGPKRRRMSRNEWKVEQRILDLLACEERQKEASAEEKEELRQEVQQLVENNRELRGEVLQLGKENLNLRADIRELGREIKELSQKQPRRAQKSPEPVATEKTNSLVDGLKKSPEKAKKQPSPASKKPRFSAGG